MGDSRISVRGIAFLIGKVAVVIVAVLGTPVACVYYLNWSAERKAKAFCDDVAIGSDISLAIEKAKDKKLLYGDYQGYTFYFPGMVFDKAVCEVSIDPSRKVTSKHSEMEYD
jgi:hypothetical protein